MKRERDERIEVRLNAEERELLKRAVESSGLSQSDIMRQALRQFARVARRRAP